jgi:hypothetical protein
MTLSLSGSEGQGSAGSRNTYFSIFCFLRQGIVDNEKGKQAKGVSRGWCTDLVQRILFCWRVVLRVWKIRCKFLVEAPAAYNNYLGPVLFSEYFSATTQIWHNVVAQEVNQSTLIHESSCFKQVVDARPQPQSPQSQNVVGRTKQTSWGFYDYLTAILLTKVKNGGVMVGVNDTEHFRCRASAYSAFGLWYKLRYWDNCSETHILYCNTVGTYRTELHY